jgi:ferric-dicitrate binding protein FerR (iron transport regulator)
MTAPPVARPVDEASEWFARLSNRHVSAHDLQAFQTWRRIPSNAAAYAKVERSGIKAGEQAANSQDRPLAEIPLRQAPKPTISWSAIPKPQTAFRMAGLVIASVVGLVIASGQPATFRIIAERLEGCGAPLIQDQPAFLRA